jgi:type II secretory pathway pseudopilin PulG
LCRFRSTGERFPLPPPDSPAAPSLPSSNRGFSVVELFIVATIILILAAIEIPNLWRARMSVNQAAGVASIRAIETAEAIYATTYGGGYSATLSQLGPPPTGQTASREAADLLDSRLAAGIKSGYRYTYIPGPVADGKIGTYTIKAAPTEPCITAYQEYTLNSNDPETVSSQTYQAATQSDPLTDIVDHTLSGGSSSGGLTSCGNP